MKVMDKKHKTGPPIIRHGVSSIARTPMVALQRQRIGQILRAKSGIGQISKKHKLQCSSGKNQTTGETASLKAIHPGSSNLPIVQRRCKACGDRLERRGIREDITPAVGAAMSPSERSYFEPRFNTGFGAVRLHVGDEASSAARALNARAFTTSQDIFFGKGEYSPGSSKGRHLLAHELTHVVQQSKTAPAMQCKKKQEEKEPPKMKVSGDAFRKSPAGGVPVQNGQLSWELKFVGKGNEMTDNPAGGFFWKLGTDVIFKTSFTPTTSACPTITFAQSVKPTTMGIWDTGVLLPTRAPGTKASMDVRYNRTRGPDTVPFYSVASSKKGLVASGSSTIAGTRKDATGKASLADAPFQRYVPKGKKAERRFESAAICVESAKTFCSISWGYSKTGDGLITLLGATEKDVQGKGASANFEPTRSAFYSGFFQLSLGDFAVGSAKLTAAHKAELAAIDTTDLSRVVLVGANDNSGGAEARLSLSSKRAKAARSFLVKKRGISSKLIYTEAHGVEAREPNPPGVAVAANRRVDVHLQRGKKTRRPDEAKLASSAERKRLRAQDPRLTLSEAMTTIVRLDATKGTLPSAEWVQLIAMLNALDIGRRLDPKLPNLRSQYRAVLARIKGRTLIGRKPARTKLPPTGPISKEVDEALRKYEEAKRRLETLKRERDEALRRLDEQYKEVLEEP